MSHLPIHRGARRRGTLLAAGAVVFMVVGGAHADDRSVAGKKLLLKQTDSGKQILKSIQKDPNVHNGNTSNDPATISGTLEVYYVDNPTNKATLTMPPPWQKNSGKVIKYKNSLAPAGPTPVKVSVVKNGDGATKNGIAKVISKGLGGITIASPGPNGIITVLSINNGGLHRMCTRYPAASITFKAGLLKAKDGVAVACPPLPTCFDGIQNQNEQCIDGGGVCAGCCGVGAGCTETADCCTGTCASGTCKCPNNLYTFNISSNNGGSVDPAEWPGGTAAQSSHTGCSATINRPSGNIDLVCSLSNNFSVNSFVGYSSCTGTGGEDGDGCSVTGCPPAGIGSCCTARPSCSAALNGSGSARYTVQCLQ